MKYLFSLLAALSVLTLQCTDDPGDPFYTDIYGLIQRNNDSTGVNGLNLRIYDIDPNDLESTRMRERTTSEHDSIDGYFEIDSIIYGTTNMQGVGYVTVVVDSTSNPGWPSQLWQPSLSGDIDSIILYIHAN